MAVAAASAKTNMGPRVFGTSIVAMDLVLRAWLREPLGGVARLAIARTVELGAESKASAAEDAHDDADEPGKNALRMQTEFVGGDHDIDEEAGKRGRLSVERPQPARQDHLGHGDRHIAAGRQDCSRKEEGPIS